MKMHQDQRGGAPVGCLAALDDIAATSVIYFRLWFDGADAQAHVWNDLAKYLGRDRAERALEAFEKLCSLCARHGRRPLIRHAVGCKCVGADESCFANFIATATDGDREDAMLIATLLVRADVAPLIASLAADFGLALKQMQLRAPRAVYGHAAQVSATLH